MKNLFVLIFWLITCSVMTNAVAAEKKAIKANAGSPVVKAGYAEPYDFRGVKLGITLSEFRQLPPLPTRRQMTPTSRAPLSDAWADFDIFTLCTGDDEAKTKWMHLDPIKGTAESGGTKCVFSYLKDPNGYFGKYDVADLGLGEYSSINYSFRFVTKPGDAEPVLYSIEISIATNDYSLLSSGLTKKFGSPSSESVNVVQNKMGAKFDSVSRRWENNSSQITLEERSISVNQGMLIYSLKSHSRYVSELLDAKTPKM